MRYLGKQATALTCWGSRTGLLKIGTGLAQSCALSCLCMADQNAPLLTTFGCNVSLLGVTSVVPLEYFRHCVLS